MKAPTTNTNGNEWIHGYLEAILDAGAAIEKHRPQDVFKQRGMEIENRQSQIAIGQRGGFNPSKFFVEEVISGYDETDIYRTWMKTIAMRNTQERNNRLENLCWRIWHLTRRKRKIQRDYESRSARRHSERERGHRDITKELSELSDGEKSDQGSKDKIAGPKLNRNYSDFQMFIQQQPQKKKSLYMVLISVHGLVRGYNMELGRDSDTGGQVKYVVELARALAMMPEVYRVDLLTRQICSPDVDWSYGEPTEMLTPGELQDAGESSGAYIVRIPCGPRDKYISKEHLWPHIQEFVDGALAHVLNMARVLGEQINAGQTHVWPHAVHGHYADAGNIAALLSGVLNVPMVLTGHSLGRNKLEQLLKQGRQSKEDINHTYRIMRRIEAEELSLDAAEVVITSTRQEIEEQWGLYDGFDVNLERKLRARAKQGMSCHGLTMPRMVVIPPGMDFSNVASPDAGETGEGDIEGGLSNDPSSPKSEPAIWGEIKRFFSNPHKPIILALARPDPKKNLTTLVKAFGECRPLRELANMVLIMGNRHDIDEMSGGNASVLTTILKLIDKYNLYGQVAYPKRHEQSDVPNIYRLTARTKGVFVNPALVEPFGLTLIEAAAHGVPMVATRNGGPVDIEKALKNGLLIDPNDQNSIAKALLTLVSDRNRWLECRRNGLKNINYYSWPQHCRIYLARIAQCRASFRQGHYDGVLDYQQVDEDFQRDSLKDVHTYLSIDDKALGVGSENSKSPMQLQNGERAPETITRKSSETVKQEPVSSNGTNPGRMLLRRKDKHVFVIAIDSYDSHGLPGKKMLTAIQEIIASAENDSSFQSPGFILSTAMTMAETVAFLNFGGLKLHDFDALICGSGSEVYYPDVYADNASILSKAHFYNDQNYAAHTDYRWSKDGLRKCMDKILSYAREGQAIMEDQTCTNEHCLAYRIKDPSQALRVDELRKNLRLRGSRCRVLYCKNESRLHVLPMLASRAQALRYLYVRWRADISNMIVFLGETGDSDYEELLSGMHKTIILKGSVDGGSERLLRGSGSFNIQDTIPLDSPNIVAAESNFNADKIKTAYKSLFI